MDPEQKVRIIAARIRALAALNDLYSAMHSHEIDTVSGVNALSSADALRNMASTLERGLLEVPPEHMDVLLESAEKVQGAVLEKDLFPIWSAALDAVASVFPEDQDSSLPQS